MAVIIDIYDENETKWTKFKRKAKEKFEVAKGWVELHEQEILFYVPVAITGAVGIYKVASRSHRIRTEKRMKDLYIYDRSMGRYVELRRKLNQRDLIDISTRRKAGERLTDILISKNLVK